MVLNASIIVFYVIFGLSSIIASATCTILAYILLHAQLMDAQLCGCMLPIMFYIEIHHRALFTSTACFILAKIIQFIEDPLTCLQFHHKTFDLSAQNFQLDHTYKTINNSNSDAIITLLIFIIASCLSMASSISHALSMFCTLELMLRHRN